MRKETKLSSGVIRQLLFSKFEVLMLVLLNIFIVLRSVFSLLKDTSDVFIDFEQFFRNEIVHSFGDVFVVIATANVATMLLWALVGGSIYAGTLAVVTGFKGAGDMLHETFNYSLPYGVKREQVLRERIINYVFSGVSAFTLILYSAILVGAVIPFVYNEISRLLELANARSFLAILYMIAFTIALHLWVVLFRLMRGMHIHNGAALL